MKNNFISILITNYNKQKFLKKCLDSVCNQSFNNYEIILFDDCSIDNSLNIIKKYKRVKLIKNKKRSNKSAPLNQIKILPYKEKKEWELVAKYSIGRKK